MCNFKYKFFLPWVISSHLRQSPAAINNSTCHPELVSGSVHYCHLEFVWRSTPILGAFYNATTFKMPKQVRHDRSVVTLNNILSRQSTACCHCTLHTCAKLVFSNVAQATYGKNYVLEITSFPFPWATSLHGAAVRLHFDPQNSRFTGQNFTHFGVIRNFLRSTST